MAHFAQVDKNNKVIQVIVINNEDVDHLPFPESEPIGIAFCQSLFGSDTAWLQTSYNNSFRRKYAGTGSFYIPSLDVFTDPQPYPSWTLDNNGYWQAPVAKPAPPSGYIALWDEDAQEWFFAINSEQI
jgi:hypothetical protein